MTRRFQIHGLHCAGCVSNAEKALNAVEGVESVSVNLPLETVSITCTDHVKKQSLFDAIEKAGYSLSEESSKKSVDEVDVWFKRTIWVAVFGFPLLIFAMWEMFISPLFSPTISLLIQLSLTTPIIVLCHHYFTSGFKALLNRHPDMNSLVALGTGSAFVFSLISGANEYFALEFAGFTSYYFESAGVILVFITLGKYLESRAKNKTTEALKSLLSTAPATGWKNINDEWVEVNIMDIEVGDIIRVKPGGKVPVDGDVIEGESYVDESVITGESSPVFKQKGDHVTGATINTNGVISFRATSVGKDTVFSRIIELVKEAQSTKAPIQSLADLIASVFVPIVILLALGSALFWFFIGGENLLFSTNILISVLIIACPCALGLATPTAIVVGSGIGAKHGIHFKSAESLQRLSEVNTVVFDKTGTLTTGEMSVQKFVSDGNDTTNLGIALGLEQLSEHHLANAIVRYCTTHQVTDIPIQQFESVQGKGIKGISQNKNIVMGSLRFLNEQSNFVSKNANSQDEAGQKQGMNVVHLAIDGEWVACFWIADTTKDESKKVIDALHSHHYETWMITGDRQAIAQPMMHTLGISHIMAEVMPHEKSEKIAELQASHGSVAMVGDGVNDAPALATADIGIAVGSGTDVAMQTGDVVLLNPSLMSLPIALSLSKQVMRKIKQNLFWAFAYNIIGIPIAMGVLYPLNGYLLQPMLAGLAMAFSSVSVVSNTLLLKRFKK